MSGGRVHWCTGEWHSTGRLHLWQRQLVPGRGTQLLQQVMWMPPSSNEIGSYVWPPVGRKELLELAPAGTSTDGLKQGHETWETLLPTRSQSLRLLGQVGWHISGAWEVLWG